MESNSNKLLKKNPQLKTTTVILGTTELTTKYGKDISVLFERTYPITVVGYVLFYLMITSNGSVDFTDDEIVQHVEESIISELHLGEEQKELFQTIPMKNIVGDLYRAMVRQAWPLLSLDPHFIRDARFVSIGYDKMEITMSRLE